MTETHEDDQNYAMILELMNGGTLYELFGRRIALDEKEAHRIIAPIFDAVIYCHNMGIAHRDIKPENILLTDKDVNVATFKVSDFGMARFIDGEQALATTMCGSPAYVAPEVLLQENNEQEGYDKVCDFWSIGVILFYLLSGKKPFECEDNFELYEMIKEGDYGDF